MKDHVQETRIVTSPFGESLEQFISELRRHARDLIDPVVDTEYEWDDYSQIVVKGWRPMTEKELEKAKAKRAAERAAKKRAKEEKENAEKTLLKELIEKYGTDI